MPNAILIERDAQPYRAALKNIEESQLPAGDVTVRIDYSTINYKDALAITGKGPVVRQFPMARVLDIARPVKYSHSPSHRRGDKVVLNGWGIGENLWGGLAQVARVKGEWLLAPASAIAGCHALAIG